MNHELEQEQKGHLRVWDACQGAFRPMQGPGPEQYLGDIGREDALHTERHWGELSLGLPEDYFLRWYGLFDYANLSPINTALTWKRPQSNTSCHLVTINCKSHPSHNPLLLSKQLKMRSFLSPGHLIIVEFHKYHSRKYDAPYPLEIHRPPMSWCLNGDN